MVENKEANGRDQSSVLFHFLFSVMLFLRIALLFFADCIILRNDVDGKGMGWSWMISV